MKIKRIVLCSLGIMVLVVCAFLVYGTQTVFPTGTTIYRPEECYNSYILVADHASLGNHASAKVRAQSVIPGDIRLIDMNGTVVHTWNVIPN
ncbi:MAG: hypothetical protein MUP98_20945, partial [Candidatus Aminicenantes bacterium]|nr:hypothetical protein [Candidatus Aminicenantes bacterium]